MKIFQFLNFFSFFFFFSEGNQKIIQSPLKFLKKERKKVEISEIPERRKEIKKINEEILEKKKELQGIEERGKEIKENREGIHKKEKKLQEIARNFFPIYSNELLKFFSLSFMMFWSIFIFILSRDIKDTLIVTNCGAEAIAFLKVYGVVPSATLFLLMYSKLATILSPSVRSSSISLFHSDHFFLFF